TGFVCMLVLALADASESEIIADYMVTYDNYYGLTEQSDKAKYDAIIAIKAMDYISYLKGLSDSGDLSNGAKKYLSLGGLNEEQTDSIVRRLKGE
ncbi:MAG: tyrosine-protein phosphatase, partial [Spirochaetales bacterium]|nr:tyrosine-protein phosphatase [Spirochaetales bacterium]